MTAALHAPVEGGSREPAPRGMHVVLASTVGDVADSHTAHYVRSLVRNGFRVTLIRPGTPPPLYEELGVRVITLPSIRNHFWLYGPGVTHLARALTQRLVNTLRMAGHLLRERPEVVMTTEPDGWLIGVLCRGPRRYYLVEDMREIYEDRAIAFPVAVRPMVRAAIRGLQRWLSGYTDDILHVSAERQAYFSYLRKRGDVVVYYPPRPSEPIVSAREQRATVTFVQAGALRHNYAANELIRAFSLAVERAPHIRLKVLGGIAGDLDELPRLRELEARGVASVLPPMPFDEVSAHLADADVGLSLVLPLDTMHYLAQPRKLYEYLAVGLPVVASDVPTIRSVIDRWEVGMAVDGRDIERLADALLSMASDAERRRRFSANAYRAAQSELNWEEQEPRLTAMVSGHRPAR